MGHAKLVDNNPIKRYPDFLRRLSKDQPETDVFVVPVVIDMRSDNADETLKRLVADFPIHRVIDNYDEQYAELLLSQHAHLYRANFEVQKSSIADMLSEHYGKTEPWRLGSWVYFPWNSQLVHVLNQKDFEDLRTIRNRDLITKEEQAILADFSTACFGMSVGSAAALGLTISGISRQISLVDGAVISGSNLNRILTGITSVGQKKCEVIARQIYEMNPYSEVRTYDKADKDNIDDILGSSSPVNLAVDEIDDIEMKIRIRLQARKKRIPVIMATELADTFMIDVERFDLEPNRQIFHGMIPGIEDVAENPPENHREWTKHAVNIIDPSNMSIKMQKSLMKIGSTIVTHPQLGSTVMATGGALAFAAKSIALGWELKSGRYVVSLEKQMLADHKTRKYRVRHKKHTKTIHKAVKSM